MINGAHVMLFSPEAEALRATLRDVIGWKHVDAGGGWLIFALPPAELGVHPDDGPGHRLYLLCDDLEATLDELRAKGIGVRGEPVEEDWGVWTTLVLPGEVEVPLYEPKHPVAAGT